MDNYEFCGSSNLQKSIKQDEPTKKDEKMASEAQMKYIHDLVERWIQRKSMLTMWQASALIQVLRTLNRAFG